ncbi:CHASE3 domain sensor protein [Actimicrobium sp. GrIS 1.19]|uniref:hypothetical protein n=1 Tax=Actimicrobium sp. GrIS 1.19 TaxID=3071708 RepID=UPI002DF930FE|nr:CHASE3 domain sensor protein [Actimicrobium sp. GrIS 1.19]
MKLSRISIWFPIATLMALGLNAAMIVLIQQADNRLVIAQQHRQQAQELTHELQQEAEQLATLVRAYSVTGNTRYPI